jgi:DNA-directed RNA polymerase specialized sigma24 family protein
MNLSYKEIAQILSCSQQRVKWQLHSALQKIKKILINEVNYDET